MPPVPVITLAASRVPDPEAVCDVAGCLWAAVVTWQVARSGVIFGDRWIAGEDVDLCREHDKRALRLTGAEDYVDA
ncbi:hypothetical protein [Micromonospora fulviviridis]|uniref:Uncharacterized protein n=1 Tax=Micromonospora fulviviridis TaxID=47860 RepID=A0ABV2VZ51_9ACTN